MDRGRDILALIVPGTVWAVHFIAIYGLISAACAPRALIGFEAVPLWGGAATVLALPLAMAPLVLRPAAAVRRTLVWCVGIACAAILADAAFLYMFQSCGG